MEKTRQVMERPRVRKEQKNKCSVSRFETHGDTCKFKTYDGELLKFNSIPGIRLGIAFLEALQVLILIRTKK